MVQKATLWPCLRCETILSYNRLTNMLLKTQGQILHSCRWQRCPIPPVRGDFHWDKSVARRLWCKGNKEGWGWRHSLGELRVTHLYNNTQGNKGANSNPHIPGSLCVRMWERDRELGGGWADGAGKGRSLDSFPITRLTSTAELVQDYKSVPPEELM